jgi:hypothetical protein
VLPASTLEYGIAFANLHADSVYQRLQPSLPNASLVGTGMSSSSRFICNSQALKFKLTSREMHI